MWTVGDVVRKIRKQRGLAIETLAKTAGLDKNTIGRLERGSPNPDSQTVTDVAKALRVSVAMLHALVPPSMDAETREVLKILGGLGKDAREDVLVVLRQEAANRADATDIR